MPTRLYLPSSGTPPLAALAKDSAWELETGLVRLPCGLSKSNTSLTESIRTWPSTSTQQWCWWQFQSPQMVAAYSWTTSDTVSMVIGLCSELALTGDTHLCYVVRVVSGDGSVIRGTIGRFLATSTEYPKTSAGGETRIHSARVDGASDFSSQIGDRIIIEIGVHGVTPSLTDIYHTIGDPSATSDFALTEGLLTNLCPWVELSRTISFGSVTVEEGISEIKYKGITASSQTNEQDLSQLAKYKLIEISTNINAKDVVSALPKYKGLNSIANLVVEETLWENLIVGTPFYVDNAVSTSGDGLTWETAWKNFSDIGWITVANATNPHLYISGGSTSKIYNEILSLGASGTLGNLIIIEPGANSPFPSGHDGIVIIDGQDTRKWCIYNNQRSYIKIYGYDQFGNYKIRLQNALQSDASGSNIYSYLGSYINIYYLDINNPKSRGIMVNGTTDGVIYGCDVDTGSVDNPYETDCIYIGTNSNNWLVDTNICIEGNLDSAYMHCDPFQVNAVTNITVRNNLFSYPTATDPNEVAVLVESISGDFYFYNNVVIGTDTNNQGAAIIKDLSVGCKLYFMNNTVIARHPTGLCLQLFSWTNDYFEVFKNNILYSPGGYLFGYPVTISFSPTSKINNNCMYRASAGDVVWAYGDGEQLYSWAEWQALGYDANGINDNPDLDSANEYRLLTGSPCLNAGADLSAYFTTDRDGKTRPIASVWDIGAYEGVG